MALGSTRTALSCRLRHGRRAAVAQACGGGEAPLTGRRAFCATAAAAALLGPGSRAVAAGGDWSSPGLASEGPDAEYRRTPGGVRFEEIVAGDGERAAQVGDVVAFQYVIRRANGYFIYATVDAPGCVGCGDGTPARATLGDGSLIAGLDELFVGMRPGGKRTAVVPPELGYVDQKLGPLPPEFGQKRQVMTHAREPLVFEVKLVKLSPSS